jgi:O-antigen ligase
VNPPSGTLPRRTFAAWIAIALLVLYLVIAGGGGAGGTLLASFRIVSLMLSALVILAWLLMAWRSPSWRPASGMWSAILAVIAAFILATAGSWSPRLSVEYLAYAILLLTLYLFLVRLFAHPTFRPRMLALAALLCGSISVIYIAVVFGYWVQWWGVVGHITTPPLRPAFEGLSYANPSAVAAITVLFLAPTIAWLPQRGRAGVIAVAVLTSLVGVTVVLTGSRGAWLALGLATGVTALLLLGRSETRRAIAERIRGLPRLGVGITAALVAAAAVTVGPAILKRLVEGGGDSLRVTLNLTALRMFADDPLTGSGPGTWVVRRAAYTRPQETDYYIPHAHNLFSQGLAEFGLIGVLAAMVVLAALGRLVLRAMADRDPARRGMAFATVFALAYLMGHQLVDSYMNLPAMLFAAILPVAFLDATTPTRESPTATTDRFAWLAASRRGLAVIALACAVSLAGLARIESIAAKSDNAAAAADKGDWAQATSLAQSAAREDPDLPANLFIAGLVTAREPGAGARQTALSLLRRSAELDDFPQAWLDVAALELDDGDMSAAHTALTRALRLGWTQPAITFPAGRLYLDLGDRAAAVEAFAQALSSAPELADDPWWQTNAEVAAVRDPSIDRAISMAAPLAAVSINLYAGRIESARTLAQALPPDEGLIAGLVVEAWAGDETARAALAALAQEHPLDSGPVVWSSTLAARNGDLAARDRYRLWAAITGGSLGSAIGEDIIVTDTPRIRFQVPGPNANFQGLYTYRRSYPWDLLVPGLPKLTKE